MASALLVAACGGSSGSTAKSADTNTTTTPRSSSPSVSTPGGPAATGKIVYVATSSAVGTARVDLLAVDAGSLAVLAHATLPFTRVSGIAVAAKSVWVTDDDLDAKGKNLLRLDAQTLATQKTIAVADELAQGVVSSGDSLLVLGDTGLHLVNTATNRVGPTLPLKSFPTDFTLAGKTLSVLYGLQAPDGAQIRRYDLTGKELGAITVDPDGSQAAGIAQVGSKLFAGLRAAGTVVVVNADTGAVSGRVAVLPPSPIDPQTGQPKARPFELTAHDGDLWVVGPDGASVLSGGKGPAKAVAVAATNGLVSAGGRLWARGFSGASVLAAGKFVPVDLKIPGATTVGLTPSVLAIGG